ncbi:xanthine dehydrogenase/oxidase-like isoform X1 [Cydia pomonella]|uniref:xanthine dehydrogenase/oxidase-like isoform X1 n=1 Tax=Cydia pomonella TaxID=82600 RepID=UPI002ADD6CD0|nr:xanthine dehydrogenase/oxidase-like isoform X1 [Cydia pomonella]
MEDTIYNHDNGEIYTDRTWNYYIMGAKDIPNDFRVYLARNRPNPVGILGSKATGEPPLCLSHCVVDALRVAIDASRQDSGYDTEHFLNIGKYLEILRYCAEAVACLTEAHGKKLLLSATD